MGTEEGHRNDDDTVIVIGQDILDEVRQIQDILGQADAQENTEEGRHEAEDIAPTVPRDFRHAAQYLDDAPEDAVQDGNADDDK